MCVYVIYNMYYVLTCHTHTHICIPTVIYYNGSNFHLILNILCAGTLVRRLPLSI